MTVGATASFAGTFTSHAVLCAVEQPVTRTTAATAANNLTFIIYSLFTKNDQYGH